MSDTRADTSGQSRLNWSTIGTVGAFIVALIALFRPDVENLIKGDRVEVSLAHEFVFNHRIGVLWVLPWVDIKNAGAKSIDIKRISIHIINGDGKVIELQGDSYMNRALPEGTFFPWTTLTILPDQRWVDRVNFREPLPQTTEEEFRRLIAELGKHWDGIDPRTLLGMYAQNEEIRHENPELLARTKAFFKSQFHLEHGHYQLLLVLESDNSDVIATAAYELTLFESAIDALENRVDEYLDSPNSFFDGSLLTSIPLTEVSDEKKVSRLLKLVNKGN